MQSSASMQSQDMLEKSFFEEVQPGDFVDVKNNEGEWNLAKVVSKGNKCLSIIFDGCSQLDEKVYITSMRVRPLRMMTFGYTGLSLGTPMAVPSIPSLQTQASAIYTLLDDRQLPSAFKITQSLRGELITLTNSLLMSNIDFSESELKHISSYLLRVIQIINRVCLLAHQYSQKYLEANQANKLVYLASPRVALVLSLHEILSLLLAVTQQGPALPRLLKRYRTELQTDNLCTHTKRNLSTLHQLLKVNNNNGKWLPTPIRLKLIRILFRFRKLEQIRAVPYDLKDYLEFYGVWPAVIELMPDKQVQERFLNFMLTAINEQTPFDAKLKSLQALRRVMERETRLRYLQTSMVSQSLMQRDILGSLLLSFNPEIFKRFIPILEIACEHEKKSITQNHVDKLFDYLENRHESEMGTICEIIVSISAFVHTAMLDYVYANIEKNVEGLLNSQHGICFIRDFTIKAINNFNHSRNRGMFSALINKKKSSSKYGYYGLDLFWRQIQDGVGPLGAHCLGLVLSNMGIIFQNECFHHLRPQYLQMCLQRIQRRQSYGQCVKLLQEIVNTYPVTAYISDNQESVVFKLDDRNKILTLLIRALKQLERTEKSKGREATAKVSFEECVKYFYELIEQFGDFLKYKLNVQNIIYLWNLPYVFHHLRKSRALPEPEATEVPPWKKKYYKKLDKQLICDIFTVILAKGEYITLSMEAFEAIDELFLSYNLQNHSLEMTEKITVRYNNLSEMVGITYFYRLLTKLLTVRAQLLTKPSQSGDNNPNAENDLSCNKQLLQKVIIRIIQIHLRPYNFQQTSAQAKNWMGCLLQLLNQTRNHPMICAFAVEKFFTLIKGRSFKDINVSGTIDIIVAYGSKVKTITLAKNSTIFKLRECIMQAFGIKTAFVMYNTAMKRTIKHFQEEDFSVNAMGVAFKGPTISLRQVLQNTLSPQHEAQELLMNDIRQRREVYDTLFKLLHEQESDTGQMDPLVAESELVQSKLWKLLEELPLSNNIKAVIEDNSNLTRKDWQQFLRPTLTVELQYRLNIVYEFMKGSHLGADPYENKRWVCNLVKGGGFDVISQLYLSKLGDRPLLNSKLVTKLSKIMLKAHQYNNHLGDQQGFDANHLPMICERIIGIIEDYLTSQPSETDWQSVQSLNLLIKFLLVSSAKHQTPSEQQFLQFLIGQGRLISLANRVLFMGKSEDSAFFTEEILEKVVFNFVKCPDTKMSIFDQLVTGHLGSLAELKKMKSVHNYFMFLVDFIQVAIPPQPQQLFTPQVAAIICNFMEQAVDTQQLLDGRQETAGQEYGADQQSVATCDNRTYSQRPTVTHSLKPIEQEIVNGALKLTQLSLHHPLVLKRPQKIFNSLLNSFILNGNNLKLKLSHKNKKLLFDIVKKLIYQHQDLCQSFIVRLQPKLQAGQWRTCAFESWNLEQQKREKKYFCGLENLGATCYMNCLFQQLFMIGKFRDGFINVDSLAYRAGTEANEIYQLQRLLVYMKYGNRRSYSTKSFCESFITYEGLPIDPMIQNDADEFFNTLMDKVETFLKLTQQHRILELTFEGKLSNQLNCEECPHNSEKIEPFLSIGLNIKNKKTLAEALEGYVEGETLAGDNAYYCETCDRKVKTIKRLCFKELPNTLVIVLKRFTYNFDEMRKVKINDECQYPECISLEQYTSEYLLGEPTRPKDHYTYRLRGVVIHSGTSEAGHYYSFIRHCQGDGKWYEFNDEFIEQADYKRIEEDGFGGEDKNSEVKMEKHSNAYILFYEKQHQRVPHIPGGGLTSPLTREGQREEQPLDKQGKSLDKEGSLEKEGQGIQNGLAHQFELQLSQLVISENNNADFMQILLDPLFVRLCESISMSGFKNLPEFVLLYFHTILLRDKNKEEYVSNIYRIIVALLHDGGQQSKGGEGRGQGKGKRIETEKKWGKEQEGKCQHDQGQHGLGSQVLGSQGQGQWSLRQEIEAKERAKAKPEALEQQTKQRNGKKVDQKVGGIGEQDALVNEIEINRNKDTNNYSTQTHNQCLQQLSMNNGDNSLNGQTRLAAWLIDQITPSYVTQFLIEAPRVPRYLCTGLILDSLKVLVRHCIPIPKYFIQSLLFCISCRKKGLNPLGKIMSYLSSIEEYRQYLLTQNYVCIVVSLLLSKETPAIQLEERESTSYFDSAASVHSNLHKELETFNSTLIQSLKYYVAEITGDNTEGRVYLNKEQLISIYEDNNNRLSRRVMADILAHLLISNSRKLSHQPDDTVPPLQTEISQLLQKLKFQLKGNICRENVQKVLLILRYLYRRANIRVGESTDHRAGEGLLPTSEQLTEMVLSEYSGLVKYYRNNYLVMELVICELNKMATSSPSFRLHWNNMVQHTQQLIKHFEYWLRQAYHPHFSLLKHEEWVSKVYGLTYPEKELMIQKNVRIQKRRVQWMMEQGKWKDKDNNNERYPERRFSCEILQSDPEDAAVGSRVNFGFKTYEVVQHLGLISKLKSDDANSQSKGMTRWAVFQKNDVDFLYDL